MFILDALQITLADAKKSEYITKVVQNHNAADVAFVNGEAAATAANIARGLAIQYFGESKSLYSQASAKFAEAANAIDPTLKYQKLIEAYQLQSQAQQKELNAEDAKRDAERYMAKVTEEQKKETQYVIEAEKYEKKAQQLNDVIEQLKQEKAKLPADKREGTFAPGTTDPTTGLTKQPGETDEEFQKRIKKALGQPDKGLGAGTVSAGGLVSAARSLLRNIALNALRTISNNPIVMLAKNLFNRSLAQQAVSLLEAAQIEEVLGSGIKQQIILLLAQAKTIDGESASNIEYWKQAIQENKQLARATHELAKGAA